MFQAWLEMAVLTNQLDLRFNNFEEICQPEFSGRRWDWVDPLKDIKAALLAVDGDLSSKQRENRKRGQSYRKIMTEKAEDELLQPEKEEEEDKVVKIA